ncbi:MAG: hypothetical protein ACRDOY_09285, partial [Nocardioidaceae bacterium]
MNDSASPEATPAGAHRAGATPPEQTSTRAWGFGLATTTESGKVLDTWYPSPALGSATADQPPAELKALEGDEPPRKVRRSVVFTEIDLTIPPSSATDAYLRLHLLSHRLVRPHGQNLEGVFGQLANVVWTSAGPCDPEDFEGTRLRLRAAVGPVQVYGVDKFPRMTDYVVPTGVRIADADRVRLGAHL